MRTRALRRRAFLRDAAATTLGLVAMGLPRQATPASLEPDSLRVATFRLDVTPPEGHPLCGGWIEPVRAVEDELEALGLVLLGAGAPIVICAVDWTGLLNGAHLDWRMALAEAAGTTIDRVAVQCVHQHNAPFACTDAQRLLDPRQGLPPILDLAFFARTVERAREAVRAAIPRARPVTHVATGLARVERVASNRRIVGRTGKVEKWRSSSVKDPALRALPEGLVDPWLRTVTLLDGRERVVSAHYYATHPMSYYGDGRVTSDFAGLARKRRQAEDPGTFHIYFTGCAGNIAAGKYNDGSPSAREELTDRLYRGMVASEGDLRPSPAQGVRWRSVDLTPASRPDLDARALASVMESATTAVDRNRTAYARAWVERASAPIPAPVTISALHLGPARLLHLPSECFVEYQLRAQERGAGAFVATAAYGDGGPWYLPTREAYPQRGYEVDVAWCAPSTDSLLMQGIEQLLT